MSDWIKIDGKKVERDMPLERSWWVADSMGNVMVMYANRDSHNQLVKNEYCMECNVPTAPGMAEAPRMSKGTPAEIFCLRFEHEQMLEEYKKLKKENRELKAQCALDEEGGAR